MLECTYCGRILKNHYSTCPGCGASSFKVAAYKHDLVIETPPKDGYKIDLNNFKKEKTLFRVFFWVGVFIIIVFVGTGIPIALFTSGIDISFSLTFGLGFTIIPLAVALPFILIGKNGINRINKKVEKVKKLTSTGTLIKNLNYEIVPTGTIVNGRPIYAIKVNYITKSGVPIPLTSEGKHDGQLSRADGTVDLLIDPNDHSNYYIDFEIY